MLDTRTIEEEFSDHFHNRLENSERAVNAIRDLAYAIHYAVSIEKRSVMFFSVSVVLTHTPDEFLEPAAETEAVTEAAT